MNAFFNRVFAGLLTVATLFLSGCATQQDTLYVPSEARQGLYAPIYGGGYSGAREVFHQGYRGCSVTRYDSAIPFSVAVPCTYLADQARERGGYPQTGSPYVGERSRYERSVLDGLLAQAREQLVRVCTPATINARLAAEAAITGVVIGAIGRSTGAVAAGAGLGAISGYSRGVTRCQEAVDWHHALLVELGKEKRHEKEVVGPKCAHVERGGVQSRVCSETSYEAWRRK